MINNFFHIGKVRTVKLYCQFSLVTEQVMIVRCFCNLYLKESSVKMMSDNRFKMYLQFIELHEVQ